MPLGQSLTVIQTEVTSSQMTTSSPQPPIEDPPLSDSIHANPSLPHSSQKGTGATDWPWQSDGVITIGRIGGSDEPTAGKRFELTCVPTSALASSYASKSTEGNVVKRDDGICAATSLTYQRLRREAPPWKRFLKILQENPILSVIITSKTNAHDCKPEIRHTADTITMAGGRKRTPDEITSLTEKWFASLFIDLAPTPVLGDIQNACEHIIPAFRSMANAFCDTHSVGKISDHQEYSDRGGRGTIERYYDVTHNGLLRYPDAQTPCLVAYGVTIKSIQSFKYRTELLRSSFEVTAELDMAIFHVFDDLTPRRVWKIVSSNQTGSLWNVRAAHRMVRA